MNCNVIILYKWCHSTSRKCAHDFTNSIALYHYALQLHCFTTNSSSTLSSPLIPHFILHSHSPIYPQFMDILYLSSTEIIHLILHFYFRPHIIKYNKETNKIGGIKSHQFVLYFKPLNCTINSIKIKHKFWWNCACKLRIALLSFITRGLSPK